MRSTAFTSLLRTLTALALLGMFFSAPARAENVCFKSGTVYVSSGEADACISSTTGSLQNVFGSNNSLAPAGNSDRSNSLTNNNVTLESGTVTGLVVGAAARDYSGAPSSVAISGNKVLINSGANAGSAVVGGWVQDYSSSGIYDPLSVSSNTVTIKGNVTSAYQFVAGGRIEISSGTPSAKVDDNQVEILNGATVSSLVYGGYALSSVPGGSVSVLNNRVIIEGKVTNAEGVYGGYVEESSKGTATVSDNRVTISGNAQISGSVYGGSSYVEGTFSQNSVTVNGGTISKDVYGVYSSAPGSTISCNTVTISCNTVTINGGTINGNVHGVYSTAPATISNNTLDINGGTIKGYMYGVYSKGGTISNNTVNINKYGSYPQLRGVNDIADGTVTTNIVNISDGFFSGIILAYSANGEVSHNELNISGGWVDTRIWGGYSSTGKVEDNRVTISGSAVVDLKSLGHIYGGESIRSVSGGAVTDNKVNISASGVTLDSGAYSADVIGGVGSYYTSTVEVSKNEVKISAGTYTGLIAGGYSGNPENSNSQSQGKVSVNTVEISGGSFSWVKNHYGRIYGGYTYGGKAIDNRVTISGGSFDSTTIYGGITNSGDAIDNKVTISGGTIVSASIYGGYSKSGTATDNKVYITGGTVNDIYGGSSDSGSATGNIVTISGGTVNNATIYGGYNTTGTATGNTVNISGGTFSKPVYGGYTSSTGTATGNTVNISGGTVSTSIYGGYSVSRSATGNIVTLSGNPEITGNIYGGYRTSGTGDVFTGNTLNKNSDVSLKTVYNFEFIHFGYSGDANITTLDTTPTGATDKRVKLNTHDKTITFSGAISGSGGIEKQGTGILTLSGSRASYAGPWVVSEGLINFNSADNFGKDVATNTLTLDGGGLQWATGTTTDISDSKRPLTLGNNGGIFDTNHNEVTLTKTIAGTGKLTKSGAGTLTLAGNNTYDGGITVNAGTLILAGTNTYTGDTTVSKGTLQIGDGNTTGSISNTGIRNNASLIFNRSDDVAYDGTISGSGALTKDGDGTLTLSAANSYTGLTDVKAGTLALSGSGTISNQLILRNATTLNNTTSAPLSLKQLDVHEKASYSGQNLDIGNGNGIVTFHLYNKDGTSSNDLSSNATLLTLNNGDATVTGATIRLVGPAPYLETGDKLNLVNDASRFTGTIANDPDTLIDLQYGATWKYKVRIEQEPNAIIALVSDGKIREEAKALPEAQGGNIALSQGGADLVADQGMAAARRVSITSSYDWGSFAIMGGHSLRHNTGSHVDSKGFSLIAGLARGIAFSAGRLTLGAFFEFDKGSYSTYNSFAGVDPVKGKGDARNLGGGLLGHLDFVGERGNHTYGEMSFRAGQSHNDYHNNDLTDSAGQAARYTSDTGYYGAHLGLGYILIPDSKSEWDFSVKYLWSRQLGDSVTLSTGEPIRFETTDSQRVRLGLRAYREAAENIQPYVGIAWEHEFGGKIKASMNGHSIDSPSLRGATGIAEVGIRISPRSRKLPLSTDLGFQILAGQRKGFAGSLNLRWEF